MTSSVAEILHALTSSATKLLHALTSNAAEILGIKSSSVAEYDDPFIFLNKFKIRLPWNKDIYSRIYITIAEWQYRQ